MGSVSSPSFGVYSRYYVPFAGVPIEQMRELKKGEMIIQPSRKVEGQLHDDSKYVAIFKSTINQGTIKIFRVVEGNFVCDGKRYKSFGSLLADYHADVVAYEKKRTCLSLVQSIMKWF